MQNTQTMEYYSALKKKGILQYVTAWFKLEEIMLSEISQSQKDKYYMIHSYEIQSSQNTKVRKNNGGFQGLGEGCMRSYCLTGMEFHFYKTKKESWWWIVVMSIQSK